MSESKPPKKSMNIEELCKTVSDLSTLDSDIIWKVANNPNCVDNPSFQNLFKDKNLDVYLAMNKKAAKYPEYEQFITSKYPAVRESVAENKRATRFESFKRLFKDRSQKVRRSVADNSEAPVKFPNEFENLFHDKDDQTKINAIVNPNAIQIPSFGQLLTDPDPKIRKLAVENEKSNELSQFPIVFDDSDKEVIERLLTRKDVWNFKEAIKLFNSDSNSIKRRIAEDPHALQYPEQYKQLFKEENEWVLLGIARNQKAVQFDEYIQLINAKDPLIREAIAENEEAVRFPEFEKLFNDPSSAVRKAICRNKQAKKFKAYPDTCRKLHEEYAKYGLDLGF